MTALRFSLHTVASQRQSNRNIPDREANVILNSLSNFYLLPGSSSGGGTRRLRNPPNLKQRAKNRKRAATVTTQAVASRDERGQPKLVNSNRSNVNKDNWLGFVGDVVNFTGEVCFKSMLRIDGNFSGNVTSENGTLIISTGAQVTKAQIDVAVAKINGTVEGRD